MPSRHKERRLASPTKTWVLVIEDVKGQAELWSDICADTGLNAVTASASVKGYRRSLESQPAIILLDLMLPDIDPHRA